MAAQIQTDPDWQHALDANLVRRLWRPVAQPGLVKAGQAQALLTRHQYMLPGSPLANLFRRAQNGPETNVAQVPIVYAQPARPSETALMQTLVQPNITVQANTTNTTETVVTQILSTSNPLPLHDSGSGAVTSADKPTPTPTPTFVQRKIAPGASPTMPTAHVGGAEPSPVYPIVNSVTVVEPQLQATHLPLVHALGPAGFGGVDGATLRTGALVQSSSRPATQTPSTGTLGAATPLTQQERLISSALSTPLTRSLFPVLPVVREVVVNPRLPVTASPLVNMREPLPFVASAVAPSQPARAATLRQQGLLRTPQLESSVPLATHAAQTQLQQSVANRPSTVPTMNVKAPPVGSSDLDRIVNKVHRKFMRQLANEAERRGMR